MPLLPNLFRTEYGKMVAVLVRSFGFSHVEEAEDLVSDTFTLAAETWGMKGVPENPTGWLYTVAKNNARDRLRRKGHFSDRIVPDLTRDQPLAEMPEPDFSPEGFQDSQLRMIFTLCHPALNTEQQVALCLRILGGFGIDEIAAAFLTTKSTINKRLHRGKSRLREELSTIELPPSSALNERLEAVLTTIYLLFNEGYHSIVTPETFRRELCADAIRLALLLTTNKKTNLPQVNALLALMCFQTSRFDARSGTDGEMILYAQQDRSLWDERLIGQGRKFLTAATASSENGRYHLEAAIAFLHTNPTESPEKWPTVLSLYNRLLQLHYSPVTALNRTYALSRIHGPKAAIAEALKIDLKGHLWYHLLLADLYGQTEEKAKAKAHLDQSLVLTKNPATKRFIAAKIAAL